MPVLWKIGWYSWGKRAKTEPKPQNDQELGPLLTELLIWKIHMPCFYQLLTLHIEKGKSRC